MKDFFTEILAWAASVILVAIYPLLVLKANLSGSRMKEGDTWHIRPRFRAYWESLDLTPTTIINNKEFGTNWWRKTTTKSLILLVFVIDKNAAIDQEIADLFK